MTIRVKCPACHQTLKAEPRHAGRTVRCPACAAPVVIPAAETPAAEDNLDPFAELAEPPSPAPPPVEPPRRPPSAKAPTRNESPPPADPGTADVGKAEISEDEVGDWLLEGLDELAGSGTPFPTNIEPIVETPNWDGVSSTYDIVEGGTVDESPPTPRPRKKKKRGP